VQTFRQHVAKNASATSRLKRDLVEHEAKRSGKLSRELRQIGYPSDAPSNVFASAEFQLRQYDALVASGRLEAADELTELVHRRVRLGADQLRRLIGLPSALVSHPLALGLEQLPEYGRFLQATTSLRGGENRLYGGDFEDLGQMIQFGWKHVSDEAPGTESRVTLTANGPHQGSYCLEMYAGAAPPTLSAGLVNNAPVWVVTHSIPVEQGEIIEITGWARVDEPIQQSIDGLEIVDSLGGPELALTIRQTAGWQPFQILRGVPESTELRVTFALTGSGTAHLDGVMVRELKRPTPQRLPPVSPVENPLGANTADRSGLLFPASNAR
jgi:hypothetical protein